MVCRQFAAVFRESLQSTTGNPHRDFRSWYVLPQQLVAVVRLNDLGQQAHHHRSTTLRPLTKPSESRHGEWPKGQGRLRDGAFDERPTGPKSVPSYSRSRTRLESKLRACSRIKGKVTRRVAGADFTAGSERFVVSWWDIFQHKIHCSLPGLRPRAGAFSSRLKLTSNSSWRGVFGSNRADLQCTVFIRWRRVSSVFASSFREQSAPR
jgi:hypothetical protein